MKRAAILYCPVEPGAPPDEEDALAQAEAVRLVLPALGYGPSPVSFTLDMERVRKDILRLKPRLTVNLVEGPGGRGRLIHLAPALLETLGLPFTGSGSEAMFLTSNKALGKRILAASGLPTPESHTLPGLASPVSRKAKDREVSGRFIIKSVWEHASIGMGPDSVVEAKDARELAALMRARKKRLGGECYAERFIDGREFNISLLAGPDGVPEALPPAEILFVNHPEGAPKIVDYAAKWDPSSHGYHNTPRSFARAPGDGPLVESLADLSLSCWKVFNLKGYARVDFRLDSQGRPWILEVNANPCIAPDSGFAAAAAEAGLSFTDVVGRIARDCSRP
jgi:D-alanine-D-alanine ligase